MNLDCMLSADGDLADLLRMPACADTNVSHKRFAGMPCVEKAEREKTEKGNVTPVLMLGDTKIIYCRLG